MEEIDFWSLVDPGVRMGLIDRTIDLKNGVALHVVERPGDGTPVICLHGIWDWWGYWRSLASDGATAFQGRPALMVDLRGHGASSKPPSGYFLTDYVSDVIALADALGAEKVCLVGHSLGALTAMGAAAGMPNRIEAVVLEDPPLPLPSGGNDMFRGVYELRRQTLPQVIEEFQLWRPWVSEAQARESAMCLKATVDGVFEATFTGLRGEVDIPPATPIDTPTLVIRAGNPEQRALSDEGIEPLRAAFPNMELVTLEGTSHNVLRDDPETYRDVIARFFSRVG